MFNNCINALEKGLAFLQLHMKHQVDCQKTKIASEITLVLTLTALTSSQYTFFNVFKAPAGLSNDGNYFIMFLALMVHLTKARTLDVTYFYTHAS